MLRTTYRSIRAADPHTHFSVLFRWAIGMAAEELVWSFGKGRK